MESILKRNIIVFSLFFKKTVLNWAFLASLTILSLFYIIMLSMMWVNSAVQWTFPQMFFISNIFILGTFLFQYKKNKEFFYDKKTHNFWIIICLFIINFFFLLILFFWTWIFAINDLLLIGQIDNSFFAYKQGVFTINWKITYYYMILLSLISFFYFEIIYKVIKKQKNFYLFLLTLFAFYFVLNVAYIIWYVDFLSTSVISGDTVYQKMNFTPDSDYYSYDPVSNTFSIYPFFMSGNQFAPYEGEFKWWIIIIDPLFPFIFFFRIAAKTYYYTQSHFIYAGSIYSASDLTVKVAYFHMELWSGYFWFMIYPYLYIMFLFSIKVFINIAYSYKS